MDGGVPDGWEVLSNVPGGCIHLHQVNTGKPKHRLLCFNLFLVLQLQVLHSMASRP